MSSLAVVGVDLAAKYSAFVALFPSGEVHSQGDSYHLDEADFVQNILHSANDLAEDPNCRVLIAIEDIPHRVKFLRQVKEACRLQGFIRAMAWDCDMEDMLRFIPPSLWQRDFGVYKVGTKATREKAESLGYKSLPKLAVDDPRFSPEGLEGKARTKILASARKTQSDYVDAFLIAKYMQEHQENLSDLIQEYHVV